MWIRLGVPGTCLAQASHIRIVTNSVLPVRVDGEPVMLETSEVIIEPKKKVRMLVRINDNE